jgi:plastin-3
MYSDLADGLIIFQLYDIIKPGVVTWPKVHRKFNRMRKFMEKLENCNYVVDLGRKQKFSLVGIAGQDICDGNATLTLALVWQLMRAYTLNMLSALPQCADNNGKLVEGEIISWVNDKLGEAGKSSMIRGFHDPTIASGLPLIDLIDAIKPGCINYELVDMEPAEEEDRIANAKYGISMARRLGARVYALPEDIVEVRLLLLLHLFLPPAARSNLYFLFLSSL